MDGYPPQVSAATREHGTRRGAGGGVVMAKGEHLGERFTEGGGEVLAPPPSAALPRPALGDRGYSAGVAETVDVRRTHPGLGMLAALVLGAVLLGWLARDWLGREAVESWTTIFVAIAFQAMPFLVLGVVVSGAIAAFVPPDLLPRLLPSRPRSPSRWRRRPGSSCPAASAARCPSPAG